METDKTEKSEITEKSENLVVLLAYLSLIIGLLWAFAQIR